MLRWFGEPRSGKAGRLRRRNLRHDRRKFDFELLEHRRLLTTAAYTWQDAAIGAGGFLDGVFFDPNNRGVMYARTDIGGLYKTTDGGNNWRPLLDFVGNSTSSSGNGTQGGDMQVLSFALDPENSNNLYALVGSAVLYSTNAGQTWGIDNLGFSVNGNGPGRGTGERIAVDPFDSNIVYVGSNTANGLYKSTNAGHSFTQVSGVAASNSITFVEFNPYDGTAGSPTQTILVGLSSNSSGSNIYETTDGGTSWTQIDNTGGPASQYPMRAAFDSADDGNIYFTYSDQLPPEGTISTTGGVWRYNLNSPAWTNITPTLPSGAATSGFVGLGVDAENPGTVVVTTFDHYNGGDFIFRTTTANTTHTWVSLYGGTSTRNTTGAPYIAAFSDGIGNWAATAAIDPFNPAHIVYGTGQGLWTTLTGNTSTTLTAPNSWYFLDYGIDFTAVIGLNAAPSGAPLFSVVGDINGFAHSALTSSPASGAILPGGSIGNMTSVDFAGTNPNLDAVVGTTGSKDGGYSTNDGATWTEFSSKPSGVSGGTVAVTSSGGTSMTIVWAPTSKAPFWSTNNGGSWTASTGSMPTGGVVFADRITPGDFYYYVSNKLWFSNNGGVSFTQETSTGLPSGGAIAVSPFTTGDLWISTGSGVFHSSNFGATWTKAGTLSSTNSRIALGAPAPGQTAPAIYISATISGFMGYYRSDDGGLTWVQINDTNHQWGGFITFNNGGAFGLMAADPNVYGRVYVATNGRGVIVGNPTSSLPAGWTDADINAPGNPGWSTSSATLSNGTVVNQWTIDGGGLGITGTSDQFNFASESITGNAAISAQLTSLTNADAAAGVPEAGVMMRAGTNPNDPFAALVQTAANSLAFKYRTTAGGVVSTVSLNGVAVGAEYVKIVNDDNQFSAFYSSNGTTWTQLGATVMIAAMPTTYDAGLAASADFNAQLTMAKFAQVAINAAPTIVSAAAAVPSSVTGTTTSLSVVGSDDGGEANLTYTWSATGPAPVAFTGNGTHAGKNSVATFSLAGDYNLTVTLTDGGGLTATSSISVTVNQTLTSIALAPSTVDLFNSQSELFSATALDQFGDAMSVQPAIAWTLDSGSIGSVDDNGLYTAPTSAIGTAVVRASSGVISSAANINVTWLKGDLNGDGQVTTADVSALMGALADLNTYQSNRGISAADLVAIADMDGDQQVTNLDISALISAIANAQLGGGDGNAASNVAVNDNTSVGGSSQPAGAVAIGNSSTGQSSVLHFDAIPSLGALPVTPVPQRSAFATNIILSAQAATTLESRPQTISTIQAVWPENSVTVNIAPDVTWTSLIVWRASVPALDAVYATSQRDANPMEYIRPVIGGNTQSAHHTLTPRQVDQLLDLSTLDFSRSLYNRGL